MRINLQALKEKTFEDLLFADLDQKDIS